MADLQVHKTEQHHVRPGRVEQTNLQREDKHQWLRS